MPSPFLFPIALNLQGKRCVVVGEGPVGQRRAAALKDAGATVASFALETTGSFRPEHLDGAFLAVAATNDSAVNAAVRQAARDRGILFNAAAPGDDGIDGDFVTMAAIHRGDLVIGLTTGGASPALAARLRQEIDAQFDEAWADYVTLLAEARQWTRSHEALRRVAESPIVRERALAGDIAGAREEARACLS